MDKTKQGSRMLRWTPPLSGVGWVLRGVLLFAVLGCFPRPVQAAATALAREPGTYYREYEIKAGFMYRFLSFVSWPEAEHAKNSQTLTIGILGRNPFGDALEPIAGRSVNGRTIQIKHFQADVDHDELKTCQMLFVSQQDEATLRELLQNIAGSPILTVGDAPGFIDKGGMIGFFTHERQRIGIEINVAAATRAGLSFRSMLMRIAGRIIEGPEAEYRRQKDFEDLRIFQMICRMFPLQDQPRVFL